MKNKVLIVEDNQLNLRLFSDLLLIKKIEVLATNDGERLIDLVTGFKPDLILMDIKLQLISGYDLIYDLKNNQHTKYIPIIAITAFATKGDEEKLLKSGCVAYISKPVSIDYFFEVIAKFLKIYSDQGLVK